MGLSGAIPTITYILASLVLVGLCLSESRGYNRRGIPITPEGSLRRRNYQTECVLGNETYEVGDKWKPNLEPNAVTCVVCECRSVRKKNRMNAKTYCYNFKDKCPKVECNNPVKSPDRCCKFCPGNNSIENIEDSIAIRQKEKEMLKKEMKKQFYALLVEQDGHETSANRVFLLLCKNRLLFLVHISKTPRPAYIRFQDLHNTIIEEYVVEGNDSNNDTHMVVGMWSKFPRDYRSMLKRKELGVSISFNSNKTAPSQMFGIIYNYNNKSTELTNEQLYLDILKSESNGKRLVNVLNATPTIVYENKNQLGDQTNSPGNEIEPALTCRIEGQIYEDGAQWKNQDDDCITCTCHRGRIKCDHEICPKLTCGEKVRIAGNCCPMCKEGGSSTNETAQFCPFGDNKNHLVGSSWHPYLPPQGFDRCTVCICTQSLEIKCQRKSCPKLQCGEKEAYWDKAYFEGCCKRCPNPKISWTVVDSDLKMAEQRMDPLELEKHYNLEKMKSGGCRFKGRVHANGEEWNPIVEPFGEVKCTKCRCKDGRVRCENLSKKCKPLLNCRNVVRRSSECCKVCADDLQHQDSTRRRSQRKAFYFPSGAI